MKEVTYTTATGQKTGKLYAIDGEMFIIETDGLLRAIHKGNVYGPINKADIPLQITVDKAELFKIHRLTGEPICKFVWDNSHHVWATLHNNNKILFVTHEHFSLDERKIVQQIR